MQLGYSPEYVLDKMQWYEINAALKYSYYAFKDGWEQSRLISYLIAQTNSRKKLSLEDITKFYWEKEHEETDTKITKTDIDRLNKMAQAYLNQKQNNGLQRKIHRKRRP